MKSSDSNQSNGILSGLSNEESSGDFFKQLRTQHRTSSGKSMKSYYFSSVTPSRLSEIERSFISKWVQEAGENSHCEGRFEEDITCEACRDFGIMKIFNFKIAATECDAYAIDENMSAEHRAIVKAKFGTITAHVEVMLQPLGFTHIEYTAYDDDNWQVPMVCYVPKDPSVDLPWFGEIDLKGRPPVLQFKGNRTSGGTCHQNA